MRKALEDMGLSKKSLVAGAAITAACFAAVMTSGLVTLFLVWAAIGSVLWLAAD